METTNNMEKINKVVENTLPAAEDIVAKTGLGKGGTVVVGAAIVAVAAFCVTKVVKFFKNKNHANDEFEGDEGVEESTYEDFDEEVE